MILLYFLLLLLYPAAVFSQQETVIPAVIVKAKKKPSNALKSDGPKTVIDQTQLTNAGVGTVTEALQNIGGVQLHNMTGNGSQASLSLRGFGANATSNTLLLINGIPLTNPDLAPPDLNSIPLNNVRLIEVVAGSESVLYGDQAVGGIVNIITQSTMPQPLSFSCSTGSYHQYGCNIAYDHRGDQWHEQVTGTLNHTDNYRDHNAYDQRVLLGRVDYLYQTGQISLHYNVSNEDMQYPGALTAQQVQQNRRQANNDTDFFADWGSFFHLQQAQSLNDAWQLTTDVSRRDMHGHGVLFVPFKQSRLIYYLKPQLKGTIKSIELTTGVDAQNDDYHLGSDAFAPTNNHEQKYSAFGMATVPLSSRFALSIGARGAEQMARLSSFSNNTTFNRALATTLGVTYQLAPDTQTYLRRAGSFRFPKADENATVANGVTALRTQRGIAYETGLAWEKARYAAKLGLYQLHLRDEIAFDPTQTPQAPFGSNQNLSPTKRYGMTLSGKAALTKKVTLNGQYNYVNARFQNGLYASKRIPLVSENIFRTGLNYHVAENWQAYAEMLFTDNQYAANDNANVTGKLGGYTVYNVNLRYTAKQWTASLRVNNLFNKAYYLYAAYQPSLLLESFYPAPERNVMFVVRVAWG